MENTSKFQRREEGEKKSSESWAKRSRSSFKEKKMRDGNDSPIMLNVVLINNVLYFTTIPLSCLSSESSVSQMREGRFVSISNTKEPQMKRKRKE